MSTSAKPPAAKRPRPRARRAVTDADKGERRSAILAAADAHLGTVGFEDFSMEVLARELGIARGTLYRYFATREDVLLALYEEKRARWCDALVEGVRPGMSDADLVQCFLQATRADPRFVALRSRLESVIEHNVSVERLVESKHLAQEVMRRLSARLAHCLDLTPTDARDVVVALGALILGAAQLDAGPSLAHVDLPDEIRETLGAFSCDDVFRTYAPMILQGIRRRGGTARGPRPSRERSRGRSRGRSTDT